ncbi:MAG: hypothetical protein V4439_04180 [Patescibacteria group bacterium]
MEITKLNISLVESNVVEVFQYVAVVIQHKKRYFYCVDNTILKITESEYNFVTANPYLYYFSTALKLHFLVQEKIRKHSKKSTNMLSFIYNLISSLNL